jgi:hypothetical protein
MKDAAESIQNYGFGSGGTFETAIEGKEFRLSTHNTSRAARGPEPLGMGGNTHVVPPKLRNPATRKNL